MAPYNDDEKEEEVRVNSIHRMKKSGRNVSSVRAITERALLIQEDHTRSIGGRLGGHFDSIRVLVDGLGMDDEEVPVEGSPFIRKHEVIPAGPPLSQWLWVALICALSYALYNIMIKLGSCCIYPLLGAVILQVVAASLGSLLLGLIVCKGGGDDIHYDRKGILWSVCAGLAVGSAEMLSFFVSSLGVQASQFVPVIIGGSVLFGCILGLLTLGETMMLHGWSGVLLLVSGIALVATDPGEKVEEGGAGEQNDEGPPPLTAWIGPALICAFAYASYNIFIKCGSASINPILGGVVLQFVAAMFGTVLLIGSSILGGVDVLHDISGTGVFWACWAGVAVGAAELLSFCVSGMGVDASKSIPVVIGGSTGFSALLGLFALGETLMLQGWSGVLLLMSGIGLVATDPGEKVAGH